MSLVQTLHYPDRPLPTIHTEHVNMPRPTTSLQPLPKFPQQSRTCNNIRQLDIRHQIRQHLIPDLRPLLIRIRIPNQRRLTPLCAQEAQSESTRT